MGTGKRRGFLPITSRYIERHSSRDRTSLASVMSLPTNLRGSANAFAPKTPRSSVHSQGRRRNDPISLGITCYAATGGKNFLWVINSMKAVGRRMVSGSPSAFM
jgi:hypothetical protein